MPDQGYLRTARRRSGALGFTGIIAVLAAAAQVTLPDNPLLVTVYCSRRINL